MKAMTEMEMTEAIEKARQEMQQMEADLAARQALPAEKRLAIDLHVNLCSGRLIGRCDWGNNGSWDQNYEMKEYLRKAEGLLAITTAEEALAIVQVIKGH